MRELSPRIGRIRVHVPVEFFAAGVGHRFRAVGRLVNLFEQFGFEPFERLARKDARFVEPSLEIRHRVVAAMRLDLFAAAIGAVVIVGRVGEKAVALRFD